MWLKNFRNRKLQAVMIMIIILLCSLLISTSVSILVSLDKPMEDLTEECQPALAVLYPYAEEDAQVEAMTSRLDELEEVRKTETVRVHYMDEEMRSGNQKIASFLNLTEYSEAVFGKIRCVKGDKTAWNALKENECLIPASTCITYKLELGDVFTVRGAEQDYHYTIRGIYADTYANSNAFDSYVLIKEVPQELFSHLEVRVYEKNHASMDEIMDSYSDTYGMELEGLPFDKEDAKDSSLLTIKIVGGILLAVGVLMLFVSCLIINFMVRNAMVADAKNIAIYKTIGYEFRTIRNMYIKFYLAIGTVSVLLGVLGAKVLSDKMLDDMFANIGLKADTQLWLTGACVYALVMGLVLLTIWGVTSAAKRMKPIYALAGLGPVNTQKKHKYRGDYRFTFSPAGLGLRMVMRDKKGTIGILVVALVSVIGINFALISLDVAFSMKEQNHYWLGIDRCDVMVDVTDGTTGEELQELLEKDGNVVRAVKSRMSSIYPVKREKDSPRMTVHPFFYESYEDVDMRTVYGRNPVTGDEIAISGKVAQSLKKEIGDYLTLEMNGEPKSFLITGLYQTYYNMGENCRLTSDAWVGEDFSYSTVSVYLKDNSNLEEEVTRIAKLIGRKGEVIPRTEKYASIMEMIAEPQESTIPAVSVMTILIGSISIFCIIMLKNNKEARTNGIYKCIGYSSSHLMKATLSYVGILAAVSILIGVPCILYFYSSIMKAALGMVFGLLEYRVEINMLHIAGGNLAIFAIFLISTLLSAGGIRKVDVRDLVTE